MIKNAKTNLKRQKEFVERQKALGLVRTPLWVPKNRADELKAIAAKMCAEIESTVGRA